MRIESTESASRRPFFSAAACPSLPPRLLHDLDAGPLAAVRLPLLHSVGAGPGSGWRRWTPPRTTTSFWVAARRATPGRVAAREKEGAARQVLRSRGLQLNPSVLSLSKKIRISLPSDRYRTSQMWPPVTLSHLILLRIQPPPPPSCGPGGREAARVASGRFDDAV
jgi:hypothetical protein